MNTLAVSVQRYLIYPEIPDSPEDTLSLNLSGYTKYAELPESSKTAVLTNMLNFKDNIGDVLII